MPPRSFTLEPPSRDGTCTCNGLCPFPLPCQTAQRTYLLCSIQLLCAWGPGLPERRRGVSGGTWAPGHWPRDVDQTPGGAGSSLLTPQEMPGAVATMLGRTLVSGPPAWALERQQAFHLPFVNSLPCSAARPLESTCCFGWNVGEFAHTRCSRGLSGQHFQALCPTATLGRVQKLFPAFSLG